MSEHGIRWPISVSNLSGFIVSGHGRLMAAQKLELDKYPVVYQDFKDQSEELAVLVADNHVAELAEIDGRLLGDIFVELDQSNYPLELTAYSPEEIRDYVEGPTGPNPQDDVVPDPPKKAKTKTGDLYILGEHRLLCGDATKKEDVDRLMDGQKADMVFTDPPYGNLKMMTARKTVATKVGQYKEYAGHGDFNFRPTWDLIRQWNCKKIIWGGNYFAEFLPITTSWLIWDKRAGDHSYFSDCELAWSNLGIPAKIMSITWQGMIREGEHDPRVHPTQKPIQLAIKTIEEFASDTKCICDLFLGSGSTMIACEKLNRCCFGMEIDPVYCDVIVKRWEDFTGKKAKLIK